MISFISLFGGFGAACLSLCAVPQLIKTYKTKRVSDLSIGSLMTWCVGCISMFAYVLFTSFDLLLLTNYLLNIIVSVGMVVIYFSYRAK